MRILLLSHTYSPWTRHYARFFHARGDDLLVVSFSKGTIGDIPIEFIGVDPWNKYANKHIYFTRVPRLRRIIQRFKPDIIYAPFVASNGLSAVLAWNGPIVTSARGGDVLDQIGRKGLRRKIREALVRFVCKRCAMVHSVSRELEDELIRLGVPESKLFLIPVGVDTARFHPAPDMPRCPATHILCSRKHEPIYDNITLVEALARLKADGREFRCTFASEGVLLESLKQRVHELGLDDRTTYTGELPHDQVPELYRHADIYVSASLSDGTSSALLEALATGLFPIVSRIPANTPWIEHERTGLLFEPHSVDQLTRLLERAMDDADLRRNAFTLNRRHVEQDGDMARNMDHLARMLEQVVHSKCPGH
ncbi:MAG TPA: glycosyltransferase [Phycisphaerae bacterium]|nr:glycosyltransferase [Phycisphaerae bacterium]